MPKCQASLCGFMPVLFAVMPSQDSHQSLSSCWHQLPDSHPTSLKARRDSLKLHFLTFSQMLLLCCFLFLIFSPGPTPLHFFMNHCGSLLFENKKQMAGRGAIKESTPYLPQKYRILQWSRHFKIKEYAVESVKVSSKWVCMYFFSSKTSCKWISV